MDIGNELLKSGGKASKRKWSPEQRKRFKATMKRKKKNGAKKHKPRSLPQKFHKPRRKKKNPSQSFPLEAIPARPVSRKKGGARTGASSVREQLAMKLLDAALALLK